MTARLAFLCALVLPPGLSAAIAGPILSSANSSLQRLDDDVDLSMALETDPEEEGTETVPTSNDPPDGDTEVFANPEPSSLALLVVGGLGLSAGIARRKIASRS